MPGVIKNHPKRSFGRRFPNSRYDDPRGGKLSALERNVLRYRAAEVALYLFYTEQLRQFMLNSVYPRASAEPDAPPWQTRSEDELGVLASRIVANAQSNGTITKVQADLILRIWNGNQPQAKKLRKAFKYAVSAKIFTASEADELIELLAYRNDVAHRIYLVMSDVSRSNIAADHLSFRTPAYKTNALDRLRDYRGSLSRRGRHLIHHLSFDGLLFEHAERTYEEELKRLDRLIRNQIQREELRVKAISAELDLSGTGLTDDLHPRDPRNQRSDHIYGDDIYPSNRHLTARGGEICFRLFDFGKSPVAVSYLMGISLRSAQRRQKGWLQAGGSKRVRRDIK